MSGAGACCWVAIGAQFRALHQLGGREVPCEAANRARAVKITINLAYTTPLVGCGSVTGNAGANRQESRWGGERGEMQYVG